jgi:hypothetical protein
MPAIPMHNSELIMECLTAWFAGSGRWTPTLHRYPEPIFDQQTGPTFLVGGLLLGAVSRAPVLFGNRLTIIDTFIARNVMAQPIKLAGDGSQSEPLEMIRLDRHPDAPVHKYALTCASSTMSVYFGLIAGDLAKYGRDERVPECRSPVVPTDPQPDSMVSCPDCGGMLFPGMVDHVWPVYRHSDMRLIYQI